MINKALAVFSILLFLLGVADNVSAELRVINATDILAEIQGGYPVKYDHVIIKGDLDINTLNLSTIPIIRRKEVEELGEMDVLDNVKLVISPITIYNSKIEGIVNLDNAFFDKPIRFIKTNFNNSANFKGSYFNETADFEDSQFDEDLYFVYSQFAKDASFKKSKFNKLSDFRWSLFNGTEFKEISFKESQFDGDAYFWGTIFNNITVFSGSNFDRSAYFKGAQFSKTANFIESKFNSSADFMGCKFNETADFRGSQFNGYIHFWKSLFDGNASFWRSQFNETADFKGLEFNGSADFRETVFNKDADFGGSQFNRDAYFSESQFSSDAYFVGANFKSNLNMTLAKYNKLYIRWFNITSFAYDDSAYLLLIDNFKKLGFFSDANNCYYRYRIDSRRYIRPLYKPVDWMLMVFYGYGTRPEYPVVWAFLVIFVSGFFFYKTNGIQKSNSAQEQRISLGEALIFSATAFTSGASAIIDSSKELTPVGASRYVITFERLLGWMFFALFLTALGKTIIG
jgi:Pentapeptide repeats (9 copies)